MVSLSPASISPDAVGVKARDQNKSHLSKPGTALLVQFLVPAITYSHAFLRSSGHSFGPAIKVPEPTDTVTKIKGDFSKVILLCRGGSRWGRAERGVDPVQGLVTHGSCLLETPESF